MEKYNCESRSQLTVTAAYNRGYRIGYYDGYKDGTADAQSGGICQSAENDAWNISIRNLDLPARTYGALDRAGYARIRDLLVLDEGTIERLRGIGAKGLHAIAQSLAEYGAAHTAWDKYL